MWEACSNKIGTTYSKDSGLFWGVLLNPSEPNMLLGGLGCICTVYFLLQGYSCIHTSIFFSVPGLVVQGKIRMRIHKVLASLRNFPLPPSRDSHRFRYNLCAHDVSMYAAFFCCCFFCSLPLLGKWTLNFEQLPDSHENWGPSRPLTGSNPWDKAIRAKIMSGFGVVKQNGYFRWRSLTT